MKTNSRPGRSGASRTSRTVKPAFDKQFVSSSLVRNRKVEFEVRTAPSRSNTNVEQNETERFLHSRHLDPGVHGADPGDFRSGVGLLRRPSAPRPVLGHSALEDEASSGPQRLAGIASSVADQS